MLYLAVYITKDKILIMEKQKIIENFKKKIIENYSNQTIKNYLSVLKLFLEWVEKRNVNKLTNEVVKDYLFYCKNDKKYSFSTMTQVITTIGFLFEKVLDKPIPKALDIKLEKPIHLPIVLSAKDISKILEVTKNIKHKTILLLLYSGGLRLGELLNLKIGDIDSESMKIHIRRAKGKKDRYVMLSENALNLLSEYYKIYQPKEYVFEGKKGGKYSPQSVQTLFKTAIKKAEIKKKATVHSLRHSFTTHLMDDGIDILYIQELLGHKRLETTQIYRQVSSYSINKIKSPADKLKLE